jgi:hypothetical protein
MNDSVNGSARGLDLTVRKLSSIRRILVAAPSYLATSSPPSNPNDLLSHRCLLHDAQPQWEFFADDRLESIRPPAAQISDSMGFLLQSA